MTDIIRAENINDSLNYGFEKGYKMGLKTHIRSLDPHFRWFPSHVVVFFGMPNYGKSTILNQMLLLRAMKEGEKFCFYTPEFSPTDFFYLDLIHAYIGKSPYHQHKENKMNRDEFEAGKKFINEHFFYLPSKKGGDSPKAINERFQKIFDETGINTFVIDPFNKMQHSWQAHGGRDDRYLGEFLENETRFAQYNKVVKIIVMHTNASISQDDEGDYKCPKIFNVAGGAMIGGRVDDMVVVHRPKRNSDPKDTTMWVESVKIKKQVLCGRPDGIFLQFNPMTNRIIDNGNCPFKGYEKDEPLPF